jgi:hypothetical protein
VVDAKAMGIINNKDRPQVSGRKNAQEEDQNYMVKITETYNPNTEITEDQTVQVTFSRVTNTQTTELQTGTASYVATTDPITIERITDLPGNIVFTNLIGYEFRLLSGETIVQDWMSSDLETIEFIFNEAFTDLVIESRSLNASISFTTFEAFTYTIKQGEQVIYEDLLDNDPVDNNEALGAMTISGLTEGLAYDVTYAGYKVIETITQDEVDGQVDKLYVLYQYTFVSFVPLNLNQRPQDQDLELDYDGIPIYDKIGFYSDSTRQSFVVDNNSGLIYKIEGINIASLSGGCLSVQDNPFPFDMRVTESNNLEFSPLHQNSMILLEQEYIFPTQQKVLMCFKDKYGNKYVKNSRLNQYDSTTKTFYYAHNYYAHNEGFNKPVSYWLNSKGEAIRVTSPILQIPTYSVMQENQNFRPLNELDNFKFYRSFLADAQFHEVVEGKVYSFLNRGKGFEMISNQIWFKRHDPFDNSFKVFNFEGLNYNIDHFYENKVFLVYSSISRKLKSVSNIYDFFDSYSDTEFNIYSWTAFESIHTSKYLNFRDNEVPELMSPKVVLEDCDLLANDIIRFGLISTIFYDLIAEKTPEGYYFKAYEIGTYVAPPVATISLQPINR